MLGVGLASITYAAQVTIKHTQITPTSATSGVQMYDTYCAVCHGLDGKGNGPAVTALKSPVPDLTQLSRQNNGKFPGDRVLQTIDGTYDIKSHGSKEMPVWGSTFRASGNPGNTAYLRLVNLTKYVESLQK